MSEEKKKSTLPQDISVGVLAAVVICVITFFVSANFVNIAQGATGVVSNGRSLFEPGRALHSRALVGMIISFISLVIIGLMHAFRKRLPNTLVVVTIMTLLALIAVAFAYSTWQTYRPTGVF